MNMTQTSIKKCTEDNKCPMSSSKASIRGLILLHSQSFVFAKDHNGMEEICFTNEACIPKTVLFRFYEWVILSLDDLKLLLPKHVGMQFINGDFH